MLLYFTIENWKSYRDRTTISMVASRERQHGLRVPKISSLKMRVLPIAAIYGGNASGKTNLFSALRFAKNFVVTGPSADTAIPLEPNKLNAECQKKPVFFSFVILASETIFEYSFLLNKTGVIDEILTRVSRNSETTLFHRTKDNCSFDDSVKDINFLKYAYKGTRNNLLLLTNIASQQGDEFIEVYNWFKQSLRLISPTAVYGQTNKLLDKGHKLYQGFHSILPLLDTGISTISGEKVPFDKAPFPEEVKEIILEVAKEGDTLNIESPSTKERYWVTLKNGQLSSEKIVTHHDGAGTSKIKFDVSEESDGTVRVLDLLPAFIEATIGGSTKVFFIDELDRSLHTLLSRQLIEFYLKNCSETSRSQILFTTHDLMLMEQEIFRRDEMWLCDRQFDGTSALVAISDYKDVRYDKDIRKSYLQGRFGGIPKLLINTCSPSFLRKGDSSDDE
jgi:uncharacterized protein